MAQDARRRKVPEPEPSALAHRALRAKLAAATTRRRPAGRDPGDRGVLSRTPPTDRESGRVNLARWEAPYAERPRGDLSRRPRPRCARRSTAGSGPTPPSGCSICRPTATSRRPSPLAEQPRRMLPEKPNLPGQLIEKAVGTARQDLGTLRQPRSRHWPPSIATKLKQPEEALEVLRDWLKIQRDRLSDTDAEGPLELANLYEELLQDRVTAVELLRKAWRIDPSSKEIAEAFRSRGFRKVQRRMGRVGASRRRQCGRRHRRKPHDPAPVSQGLRGLTPDEVRSAWGANPTA